MHWIDAVFRIAAQERTPAIFVTLLLGMSAAQYLECNSSISMQSVGSRTHQSAVHWIDAFRRIDIIRVQCTGSMQSVGSSTYQCAVHWIDAVRRIDPIRVQCTGSIRATSSQKWLFLVG